MFVRKASCFISNAKAARMLLRKTVNNFIDTTLALFFPQACAVCKGSVENRAEGVACARCWSDTELLTRDQALCGKCGEFLEKAPASISTAGSQCGRCRDAAYDAVRTCGIYDKALRASVLNLKRLPHVSVRISELMCELTNAAPLNVATLIVAVPLHPKRLRERGFNQAAILAADLSRRSGLPYFEEVLNRKKHSERHRAGMDAQMRHESVKGVFEVRKPRLIAGTNVLLVDDVFTTGATVSECARVMKLAGAETVYVLTLARPRAFNRFEPGGFV
jgi:ComF family protein